MRFGYSLLFLNACSGLSLYLSQLGKSCHSLCSENLEGRTVWEDYQHLKDLVAKIDMSHCGFIETPAITYSLGGNSHHWRFTGMGAIYSPTKDAFKVYLDTEKRMGVSDAHKHNYHIMYQAHGRVC